MLWVYLGTLLAAGWIFLVWYARSDRERSLQAARYQSATVAVAVAHNFAAMLHDGVGAAQAGATEIEARKADRLTSSERAHILQRMLTGGEYVRELFIVYPDEYLDARRVSSQQTEAQWGERPAWLNSLLEASGDHWVGKPLTRSRDADVRVPVARKITLSDRSIWVGAVISGASFETVARTLISEEGGLSIVSFDGLVVMRAPASDVDYVGKSVADTPEFKKAITTNEATVFIDGRDPLTAEPRMLVSRRIVGWPLFAVSGRHPEAVLTRWRGRLYASIKIAAAGSVALIVLTLSLYLTLKRRYEILRRSEERFQLAIRGTSDGIWDWNIKAGRAFFSPRLRELLCLPGAGEFRADIKDLISLTHPDDVERIQRALNDHLHDGAAFDIEVRFRCGQNGYRRFHCRGASVRDDNNEAVRMAGSISDVHDRREAEQSLDQARMRELRAHELFSEQLMVAQERERRRLANELHDSIGQNLSIIKNRATLALRQQAQIEPSEQFKSIAEVATTAIGELRAVVHNLLPVHVEQLGLSEALRALIEEFQTAFSTQIEARIEDVDDAFDDSDAMHVFRIVQELVNNVLKHAQSSCCKISIERDVRSVRVRVEDDGIGMPHIAVRSTGLGLRSIEHRARTLGAQLQIRSEPQLGTSVDLEIPINETARECELGKMQEGM